MADPHDDWLIFTAAWTCAPTLRTGIERVTGIKQVCATGGEKSFHFAHRLGNRAVRLAGLNLAPKLKKGAIGRVEPVCQHCSNITERDRILGQQRTRVRYV